MWVRIPPRVLSAVDEIDALVAIGRRAPGSDAERRAARHLEARLRRLGRPAEIEPLDCWPRWALACALTVALSALGSVLSVSQPVIGTALALAGALLLVLEIGVLIPVARRLLGRRASQNVISRGPRRRPGLIVLVAHYDAGRGGMALGRRLRRRFGARPLVAAQLAVLACCLARVAGVDSVALGVVQFVPTVVLVVAVALLLDMALSPTRPGENDNASGVALALGVAEQLGPRPLDHFDVELLFTGGQKAMAAGMRSFLVRHRPELSKQSTVFVNLDEVGAGNPHYARKEGPLLALKTPTELMNLCDGADYVDRSPGDCYAARLRGFPALTVSCGPAHAGLEAEAIQRAETFCLELIQRLDKELGPELAAPVSSSG